MSNIFGVVTQADVMRDRVLKDSGENQLYTELYDTSKTNDLGEHPGVGVFVSFGEAVMEPSYVYESGPKGSAVEWANGKMLYDSVGTGKEKY